MTSRNDRVCPATIRDRRDRGIDRTLLYASALLRQTTAIAFALLLPLLAQAQELRAAPDLPLQGVGRVNAIAVGSVAERWTT